MSIENIEVKSLPQFISAVLRQRRGWARGLWFRGQANSSWQLVPGIRRIKDQDENTLRSEFERRALEKSHIEVGSLLAQHWELPDYLIDTIAGHEALGEENGIPNSVKVVSVMRGDSVETDIERVIEASRAVVEFDEDKLRDDLAQASEAAGTFFSAMT